MVSDAIATRLIADNPLAALIGDRVYPVVAKQTTAQPFVVYVMDSAPRQVTYAGTHALVQGDLEVHCYAKSYKVVKQVAAAVKASLVDFSGSMSANTSPVSSVQVNTIQYLGDNDLEDEDPGLYRVLQRFTVWYYE